MKSTRTSDGYTTIIQTPVYQRDVQSNHMEVITSGGNKIILVWIAS